MSDREIVKEIDDIMEHISSAIKPTSVVVASKKHSSSFIYQSLMVVIRNALCDYYLPPTTTNE